MGRKGSLLVPFFRNGLEKNLYGSRLKYVDKNDKHVFRIVLPRKSKSTNVDDIQLLKDWNAFKGRADIRYSAAKQAIISACNKSDYLERIPDPNFPLTYRILNPEEVKGKKYIKNVKKVKDTSYFSPSSVDSGYTSYLESPQSNFENQTPPSSPEQILMYENGKQEPSYDVEHEKPDLLSAIAHDHFFGFSSGNATNDFQLLYADNENSEDLALKKLSGNFSKDFPLSDTEWKEYLDDLQNNSDSNMENNVTGKTKEDVKAYKYKNEILIDENLIMMTFEPVNKEVRVETSLCGMQLLLDLDLLNRIQTCEQINSVYVGDYWQLFLKPLQAGNF